MPARCASRQDRDRDRGGGGGGGGGPDLQRVFEQFSRETIERVQETARRQDASEAALHKIGVLRKELLVFFGLFWRANWGGDGEGEGEGEGGGG